MFITLTDKIVFFILNHQDKCNIFINLLIRLNFKDITIHAKKAGFVQSVNLFDAYRIVCCLFY